METSLLALQVESVQRSVAFLQREHLALLNDLHLELLSLQKRCNDLTCELKVTPPGRSQAEVEEEEEQLEARCQQVEMQLGERQCAMGELRTELSHKGALVGALRASLKDRERRFLEELKLRSHRGTVLRTELQKQAESAAYLSFQLHCARKKLHQQRLGAREADHSPLPSPPPPPPPPSAPRLKHHHKPSAHIRAERARECIPRHRVTGPEEPTPMPDPALFLQPHRNRPRPPCSDTQKLPGGGGASPGGGAGGPGGGGVPSVADTAPNVAATEIGAEEP
ncbi:hypothetical protein MATL_G00115470 [Megalops atlanticus]|uniref:CCDC92/74 N-terminal domain-containing protein n=1 Tax=Megalops atlanticus TaxID=7932 RepID=A0A9D3PWP6_MEGAT|nr:hypothetical protein MATL_G00115470 [Megalops atlanticus]